MAECNKCSAPVFWVQTQTSGKNNLLDAEPADVGDIVIITDPKTKPRSARTVSPREWADNPTRYRSHFVTCPNSAIAEQIRQRGQARHRDRKWSKS